MFSCVPPALMRVKTILVPSGDQPGWKQDVDLGSENAPPHGGVIGSWCGALPSALTTQIARRWLAALRAANRILLPLGDQLPPKEASRIIAGGVICRRPLPLSL